MSDAPISAGHTLMRLPKYGTVFGALVVLCAAASCSQTANPPEIETVLSDQVAAWNRGDINGFMVGYWQSDELAFESSSGVIKGWQSVLERYQKRYPTRDQMGQLRFRDLVIAKTGTDLAEASGRWEVRAAEGRSSGHFYLTMRQIDGRWVIVKDRTTSD